MGHDITAHLGLRLPTDPRSVACGDELGEEIAYLRRGSRNSLVRAFYAALDAQSYDGGVSGGGIGRWFTHEQLQEAMRRLRLAHEKEPLYTPEIRFMQACLNHVSARQPLIYILFG